MVGEVSNFVQENQKVNGLAKYHIEQLAANYAIAEKRLAASKNPRSQFLGWEDVKSGLAQYLDWYRARCVFNKSKMNHNDLTDFVVA